MFCFVLCLKLERPHVSTHSKRSDISQKQQPNYPLEKEGWKAIYGEAIDAVGEIK
jgi:hypothetical protein